MDTDKKKMELLMRTENAHKEVIRALLILVDAITQERNYYRSLCEVNDGSQITNVEE